jgi:hypothetical protein
MKISKSKKIYIGVGAGLIALVTFGLLYQNNKKNKSNPVSKKQNFKSDFSEEPKIIDNKSSDTELPLLKERVYIAENRLKFRDPKTEGYDEFIERTKKALDETHQKKLIFYIDDSEYVLVKINEKGEEVVASIKK